MTITPPRLQSMLSAPIVANNFLAIQSALLAAGTGSASVTFTNIPNTQRVTYKLTNTGSNTAYLCGSNSAAVRVAVASSSTPQPTSGAVQVSNCDCLPAGAILTQDYVGGTDTISAIVSAGTTSIEISIGQGQ